MALANRSTQRAGVRLRLVGSPEPGERPVEQHSLLNLWHLLSLDAPCVAALWTVFAAWCAGVHLSPVDPLAMFVAVWALYATDRLLDARPLMNGFSPPELEKRHLFHHRHRRRLLPALLTATLLLALLLHLLLGAVLHLYAVLATLLTGWLMIVHVPASPLASTRRLPKELAVGLFFPAAVFIPTVARAPGLHIALLPGLLLFAGICTANCLFLYAWEHPDDQGQAHVTTRYAVDRLLGLTFFLLATSAAIAFAFIILPRTGLLSPSPLPHPAAMPFACALTAGLLLLLHFMRAHVPPLRLRALADLVLLTPILPIAFAILDPSR